VTARPNTSGFGEGYSSSFNVYIQVDDLASEELRIGAAVEVEMVLEEKQNVISIPLECVRIEGMATGDSPRSFTYNPFLPYRMARRQPEQPLTDGQNEKEEIRRSLFVNENGIARKRPITTGAANENIVEVLSGLKEGELVVAIGNAEIVEGMKLTIP
jgi:multidrug efflux pump subunit AcrA (membrane-fusion protein)